VNRVVGQAGKGQLRAALVPEGVRFLGENHVNVVFHPKGSNGLKSTLRQMNSGVVQKITGNTQVSKKELEGLIPFDKTC